MNWLKQIDDEIETNLVKAIDALEAAYQSRRHQLEQALGLVREGKQTPLFSDNGASAAPTTPQKSASEPEIPSAPRSNVEIVESAVIGLPSTFDFHDVAKAVQKTTKALNRRQIGSAFRKIVKRRESPIEQIRKGSGNIPHLFRHRGS